MRPQFQKEVSKSTQEISEKAAKLKEAVKEDYRIKVSDHPILVFITLIKKIVFAHVKH